MRFKQRWGPQLYLKAYEPIDSIKPLLVLGELLSLCACAIDPVKLPFPFRSAFISMCMCEHYLSICTGARNIYKVISWTGGRLLKIANGRKWLLLSSFRQQSPAHHLFYGRIICHCFITMSKFITSASYHFQHRMLVCVILGFAGLFRILRWFNVHFLFCSTDPVNRNPVNGSATTHVVQDSATTNDLPGQAWCCYHFDKWFSELRPHFYILYSCTCIHYH